MVIPWEFNIETETINEPFNFNYECKIQYSHYSGSICKLNENYFIVGGFANFGFFIKYNILMENYIQIAFLIIIIFKEYVFYLIILLFVEKIMLIINFY